MSPRLALLPDRVEKRQPPDHAAVEAEKLRQGGRLGADTGLFSTPEILQDDAAHGLLVLRRIRDAAPLAEAISDCSRADALVRAVGRAVAAIHDGLRLGPEWTSDAPDLGIDGERVFVHGDLTLSNVLVLDAADGLVLLDWATPDWLGGRGTRASPLQDLGVFVASLFEHAGGHLGRDPRAARLARAFLGAYVDARAQPVDLAPFGRYFDALQARWAHAYRGRRGVMRWAAHQPALAAQRRFAHAAATELG